MALSPVWHYSCCPCSLSSPVCTNSPLWILISNSRVLFGGGRASSSVGALWGEQEAAVGVTRVDTRPLRAVVLMEMMHFSSWMVVGAAWSWCGCRGAVLKNNRSGLCRQDIRFKIETPWVPPSAGPCPSSLWDVPLGEEVLLSCGSAVPSLEPQTGIREKCGKKRCQ